MPRLRRIKDYEIDFSTIREEPSHEADVDESESERHQGFEQNQHSGSSWWSNEAMVASLDDTKLQQAYDRYRALADMCQWELRRRALAPAKPRRGPLDNMAGRYARNEQSLRASVKRAPRGRNQVKLNSQQMLKALELLCKNVKSVTEKEK